MIWNFIFYTLFPFLVGCIIGKNILNIIKSYYGYNQNETKNKKDLV